MKALELINKNERVIPPYSSVASIEPLLTRAGYIAVKDGSRFLGLVTEADVIDRAHTLVIDCITQKQAIPGTIGIEETLRLMRQRGQRFLPVEDDRGGYAGTISMDAILSALGSMRRAPLRVKITNQVASLSTEESKQTFLRQVTHHVKNPLQVIQSSVNLLRDGTGVQETEILLDTIATCAKEIDEVIERLSFELVQRSELEVDGKPSSS